MNENAQRWVEALQGDEFEQTQGTLHDENGYCCLGVACELYRREHPETTSWRVAGTVKKYFGFISPSDPHGGYYVLPSVVSEWLGLRNTGGEYASLSGNDEPSLAGLNDEGIPFPDIATVIASEPKGLFK